MGESEGQEEQSKKGGELFLSYSDLTINTVMPGQSMKERLDEFAWKGASGCPPLCTALTIVAKRTERRVPAQDFK